MCRNPKIILCPINLRHVKLDYTAYTEAWEMAARHNAKLIVATIAPEFERNMNIYDSDAYWGDELKKFVAAHPPEGVEYETLVSSFKCDG